MTSLHGNAFHIICPLLGGIWPLVYYPHKRLVIRSFDISLVVSQNSQAVGDLRRHDAHVVKSTGA